MVHRLNSIAKYSFSVFLFLTVTLFCNAELQVVIATAPDVFVFYSTSPGKTAMDGPPDGLSPFAEAFLNNVHNDEPLNLLAIDITSDTYKITSGRQMPAYDSKIIYNKMYSLASRDFTKRYALLIGNADYPDISKLDNPVYDVQEIAAALGLLGFEVDLLIDGNMTDMERAINTFTTKLASERESEGFFWYAGHGIEIDREAYMLPVDCNINSVSLMLASSVSLSSLTGKLDSSRNKINVVFLDINRTNP